MRLVADENIDFPLVVALRRVGVEVLSIEESHPGIDDRQVIQIAEAAQSILLTGDKDFGDLVFRQGYNVPAVVLLRLAGLTGLQKVEIVTSFFREEAEAILGSFCVVGELSSRIRPLPTRPVE